METDNIDNEEFINPEFDKWLAGTLKENMVQPPQGFSTRVTKLVCEREEHRPIEPGFLLLVAFLSLLLVIWIIISFILPPGVIEKTVSPSIFQWIGDINSILKIGNLILLIGAGFFGIDMILNKYLTGKDIMPI